MDSKFNLHLLIVCCSISSIFCASEDVAKRYIFTHPIRSQPNSNNSPINQNTDLNTGAIRNEKIESFIQYQPASTFEIIQTPITQLNTGSTIQYPITGSTTTTTYRFSNHQDVNNIKKNVQDNLFRVIDLVEQTDQNKRLNPATQTNQNQYRTTTTIQYQPQLQNQPQIRFQSAPQLIYQPQTFTQNSNQPQYQATVQTQYQNPAQFTQKYVQNQYRNQIPQNQGQNKEFQSPGFKIDDDKIGKGALASVLGPG